jgi:hypothetical protein
MSGVLRSLALHYIDKDHCVDILPYSLVAATASVMVLATLGTTQALDLSMGLSEKIVSPLPRLMSRAFSISVASS